MDRAKRARLLELQEIGVSTRSLVRIAERCNRDTPEDARIDFTRQDLDRALQHEYGHVLLTLTLQTSDGPFDWVVARVAEVMQLYLDSPTPAPQVAEGLRQWPNSPSHPWRLCFLLGRAHSWQCTEAQQRPQVDGILHDDRRATTCHT